MKLKDNGSIRYSPGERKAFALLNGKPQSTSKLCERYYAPLTPHYHGRVMMIGIMAALLRKTALNREPFIIQRTKRAGPKPVEFWLEKK